MAGWIKLHRRLLSWEWFADPITLSVFICLLLSVNHKPAKWRGIDVSCGQHITSAEKIASRTGLSRQQVRTALNKLKLTGEITVKATNKYSLITVENWAFFQNGIDECNQQPNHHSNHEITNNQPTKQPSTNHKQEVKEVNNEKNARREESPAPPLAVEGEAAELISIRNSYAFNGELSEAVNKWITYKSEKRQPYTPSGLNSLLSQVRKHVDEYSDTAVVHAIHESMASNYNGIIWEKAKTAAKNAPQRENPFFEIASQKEDVEGGYTF